MQRVRLYIVHSTNLIKVLHYSQVKFFEAGGLAQKVLTIALAQLRLSLQNTKTVDFQVVMSDAIPLLCQDCPTLP